MARAIRVVEPLAVLPFAGPPCFLDPELRSNNSEMERGIFPDQQQVATWLTRRGIANVPVLLPGDAWDVGARRKEGDARWSDFSFDDRARYIEAYARGDAEFFDAMRQLGNASEPFETDIEIVNQAFRMGGDHLFAWDFAVMRRRLEAVGFVNVEQTDYDPMRFIDQPDDWRRRESLYVVAYAPRLPATSPVELRAEPGKAASDPLSHLR